MKKSIKINGICCSGCTSKIEKALKELAETEKVEINSSEGIVSLELSKDVDNDLIKNIIAGSGHYTVTEIV
jgi:copper chaperone CopZ